MALNEKKQAGESSRGLGKFLMEVKAETKRITWPPKKDIKKSTIIVLLFCTVSAVLIGMMDYGLSGLYKVIFNK